LSKTEVVYQGIFRDLPAAIVLVNRDGMVIDINRAFLSYVQESNLDVDVAGWEGRSLVEWLGLEQAEQVAELIEQACAAEQTEPLEITHGVASRWLEIQAGPCAEEGGVWLLWRDITLQKKSTAALQNVQKLEVFGQLGSGVAHDLNNELSLVNGYAELLLGEDLAANVRTHIETVLSGGRRCGITAERLLNYARWLRLGRQVQELNPIVVNAIDMMRRQFEKDGVVLLEDLDADLPQIEVWAGQIQVVLFNLLQNSREALLRGGVDGIVQVRTYWREPWVVLEVEDDGPGVAEPQRQHIFDASFSAKEGELGAGLGLGVCRDIARDHGGQMKLLGEPPEVCMAL
jgi:signal transduction histidine kinase